MAYIKLVNHQINLIYTVAFYILLTLALAIYSIVLISLISNLSVFVFLSQPLWLL